MLHRVWRVGLVLLGDLLGEVPLRYRPLPAVDDVTRVLILALLPFAGNFAGAALAETLPPSDAWRNRALQAAVGIVFAVVAIEIMPEALEVLAGWQIAVAFLVGGGVYLLAQSIIASRAEPADACG